MFTGTFSHYFLQFSLKSVKWVMRYFANKVNSVDLTVITKILGKDADQCAVLREEVLKLRSQDPQGSVSHSLGVCKINYNKLLVR